ncbi:uncharacterized protein LOC115308461 [Ixodes scapularis]|uniref:uncharacterized protein LOC115308461 n=1 Tax=Ixodes scapularis TaxID=6945 RepID=UPI001A9EFB8D|nr:uncharacterized protein LOC115308461 [Ixodes scapularis]
MRLLLLTIPTILNVRCISASKEFPEVNPMLGPWQDLNMVFPLTDTWYVTYRNYEEDPVFGAAKCLRTKQDSPETESGYPIIVNYDGLDEPITLLLTTSPSDGYTVNNRIKVVPEGGGEATEYHVIYGELDVCAISRNPYINDEAMMVFVSKAYIEKNGPKATCCDFLYTMLGGSSEKYDIYEERCLTSE